MITLTRVRRTLIATTVALAGVAASSGTAVAGTLTTTADCGPRTFTTPFTQFGDTALYSLVPGATMESTLTSWQLNGARVVRDQETYKVAGPGKYALSLPVGASVTTRAMCIGVDYPSMRYFLRNAGTGTAGLGVKVLFEINNGGTGTITLTSPSTISSAWQPSPVTQLLINNFAPLTASDKLVVAFQFTNTGKSEVRLDDVFVDPYRTR